MGHLITRLEDVWTAQGDRCAVIDWTEGEVSYTQLMERVRRMAAVLRRYDIPPGGRVLSSVRKSLDAIILQFAILRIGALHNPVNPGLAANELAHVLEDAAPALVVTDERDFETAVPKASISKLVDLANSAYPECVAPSGNGEDAVLLYTSGTTGRPKGAVITHDMWLTLLDTLADAWQFSPPDRLLHVLPIFHGHGLVLGTYLPLICGARIDLRPRFDIADFADRLPETTVVMAVPTIYTRLVEAKALTPDRCPNMRLFISGSAALPSHVHTAFQKMTGEMILERYGTTETGIICSNPVQGERRPGKVGPPLECIEMRLMGKNGREVEAGEVGEIQVRGPTVLDHYWNKPREPKDFTQDGYFVPGDLARMDHDGYVEIVGRSKEMIVSGGFNVYPVEVENAMREDHAIQDIAVFGVPHRDFGEAVVAAIILASGSDRSEPELTEFLRNHLTSYKIPKKFVFVRDFPRNAMGKVQRNVLSRHYSNMFDPEGSSDLAEEGRYL